MGAFLGDAMGYYFEGMIKLPSENQTIMCINLELEGGDNNVSKG
jgi:hypothetical protein